jgi:hypothetical protein
VPQQANLPLFSPHHTANIYFGDNIDHTILDTRYWEADKAGASAIKCQCSMDRIPATRIVGDQKERHPSNNFFVTIQYVTKQN